MLKRFGYYTNGKKVELEILEKVSNTELKVNITIDGKEIAREEKANICRLSNKPGKLYLQLQNNTFLTICDKSRSIEKNMEIANWIWRNIQNCDVNGTVYGFTTEHWANWEGK